MFNVGDRVYCNKEEKEGDVINVDSYSPNVIQVDFGGYKRRYTEDGKIVPGGVTRLKNISVKSTEFVDTNNL